MGYSHNKDKPVELFQALIWNKWLMTLQEWTKLLHWHQIKKP